MSNIDPTAVLAGLDAEQREVAVCLGGPVVVIAGAGTGKTRALTHRIAYGVATGVYDPRSVLAVTFTTRAAGELRGRLRALGVGGVQARTFHAAALAQVRHFWPLVRGGEAPPVADNPLRLVAQACAQVRLPGDPALLRDVAAEIAWAKTSNVGPGDYVQAATLEHRQVGALDPAQVVALMTGYERVKQAAGVMDFGDILLAAAALLAQSEEVARAVRAQYRHFLVDEYQDVSPIQHTLLRLWLGPGDDVCVVGDPAQSIHAFAGAARRYLMDFGHEFPQARRLELVRNYRSSRTICDLANRIARRSPADLGAVDLRPTRPAGPAVTLAEFADADDEAADVAAWLVAQQAAGVDWTDLAVLFRVNAQGPALEAALTEAHVPYVVRGSERFYERPEIRTALAALRAAAQTDPAGPAVAGVEAALTRLGWTRAAPPGAGHTRERWESWQALMGLAAEMAVSRPRLGDVVDELTRRATDQQVPPAAGVTLATMHAAKGLEWRGVALIGLQEGMVPFTLAHTPDELAEEHRLFYVGVTRARDVLRLSWAHGGSDVRGRRRPSRFLVDIGLADGRPARAARATTPKGRRGARVVSCRVCGRTLISGAEIKLGRHAACPAGYDEALLDALKAWRRNRSHADGVPAYVVFTDATLQAIAEARPVDRAALAAVSGIGPAKLERYGAAILALVTAPSTS